MIPGQADKFKDKTFQLRGFAKVLVSKRIFISADHGMAIIYFLQSDVVPTLLAAGVEIVVLTDDDTKEKIAQRFTRPGLTFEGLRLKQANDYASKVSPRLAVAARLPAPRRRLAPHQHRSHGQPHLGSLGGERLEIPFGHLDSLRAGDSSPAEFFLRPQTFSADAEPLHAYPGLYTDLFEKYQPDMVIASTPGWRMDRYLLRESARRGIPNMTVIVGWDNSSSYNVSGADVQWATCWSELQKEELVKGSDWNPEHVHVGGIPSYDGYFRKQWLMPRDEYFKLHGLDPKRKLISYASSFVHFAPNYPEHRSAGKIGFI